MRPVLHVDRAGKPQYSERRLPLSPTFFADDILVECPKCSGCALVRRLDRYGKRVSVRCSACGYSAEPESRCAHTLPMYVEGRDPFLGLPLWLRERYAGHVLWAFNWRHLEDLEFFLNGEWRLNRALLGSTITVHSHRPRYPQWMFHVKQRAQLLRVVQRIKKRRL